MCYLFSFSEDVPCKNGLTSRKTPQNYNLFWIYAKKIVFLHDFC